MPIYLELNGVPLSHVYTLFIWLATVSKISCAYWCAFALIVRTKTCAFENARSTIERIYFMSGLALSKCYGPHLTVQKRLRKRPGTCK